MSCADKDISDFDIQGDERLGRRVSDPYGKGLKNLNRLLNRLESGVSIPYQEFLSPNKLPSAISVDLLDQAPSLQAIADIALRNLSNNNRVFHGWAAVISEFVIGLGLTVQSTPDPESTPPNPYHADIFIPGTEKKAKCVRIIRAKELAEKADWIENPQTMP